MCINCIGYNWSNVLIVCMNDQREGTSVASLESKGSKGSVQVNGKIIKKGTSCVLNSGDEVVFGLSGNYAYVSISFVGWLFDQF